MTIQTTPLQDDQIRLEFADLAQKLRDSEPIPLARTWGFEIETPDADRVHDNASREDLEVIEFHQDPSVSEGDNGWGDTCDCDCRACTYHDCDCDNCDDQNTDPDHDCGSSECYSSSGEYQEIVSIGGLSNTHPEALEAVERLGLRSCQITAECGLHIHIASADLSPLQVAKLLTVWRLVAHVLDPISGHNRKENRFCRDHTEHDEERVRRGEVTERYLTWNTQSHFSPAFGRPQTLELRKHSGTNDPDRVRAWAWLAVGMVEFAKSDRPVYWLGQVHTLADLVRHLGIRAVS
jgi:hypothetical protein